MLITAVQKATALTDAITRRSALETVQELLVAAWERALDASTLRP
jgi:hypothetical protein